MPIPPLLLTTFWHMLQQPPPAHWRKWLERSTSQRSSHRTGCVIALLAAVTIGGLALIAGAIWAVLLADRSSAVIGRIRSGGEYEVLAVTPDGAAGANLNILRGLLHYAVTVEDFIRQQWLATLVIALFAIFNYTPATPLPSVFAWLLLVLAVHVDQEYGLITGGMVGIWVPSDLRPFAGVIAAGLHGSGYALAALASLLIPPILSAVLGQDALSALLSPLVVFGLFILWREVTLRVLSEGISNSSYRL